MLRINGLCLLSAIFLLVFSSCFTGFFPETKETIDGIERVHTTTVQFSNVGIFRVKVFIDNGRNDQIGDIPALSTSNPVECYPHALFNFYLTYFLKINDIVIPFAPPLNKGGFHPYPVPRNINTVVPIPHLNESITNPDEVLITDAYYFSIKNSSSRILNLAFGSGGTSVIQETIGGEVNIMANQTGVYKLTNTNLSSIGLIVGAITNLPLPISSVTRGSIYSFEYNGTSLYLLNETQITLRNTSL